jgi:hypothetical protein
VTIFYAAWITVWVNIQFDGFKCMKFNTEPYLDRYALPRGGNFHRLPGFIYKSGGKFWGLKGR